MGVYCVFVFFFSHIIAMWNRITNTRTQSFSFLYNCGCYTWKWATLPLKRFNCVIYYAIKIVLLVLKWCGDIDLRLRLRWIFENLWFCGSQRESSEETIEDDVCEIDRWSHTNFNPLVRPVCFPWWMLGIKKWLKKLVNNFMVRYVIV